MNKIIISTYQNSPIIPLAEELSKKYNKSFAVQDYEKAYNLLHKYDYPMYDQLVSDGPGYNLADSFKENIYANYDVVVVSFLSLNIIAEAIMNNFNSILFVKDLPKTNRLRGTVNFAMQNFENCIFLDEDIEEEKFIIETLWSKND